MKSKKIALFAIGITITGLVAFFLYRNFYPERVIATVGDYEITQRDQILRDQIQQVFYPQDPNSYGLEQLIKAFTYAQILKNNGLEITDHILRAEDMRINQNSKAPETLKRIRDFFHGDEEKYKKVFVLPTYAERTIYYDFFNKNPKAQEQSLARVREFLNQLDKTNAPLDKLAHQQNLIFKKFTLSKDKGLEWEKEPAPKNKGPKGANLVDMTAEAPAEIRNHIDQEFQGKSLESARFWIENVLINLKPGQVLHEPVDNESSWMVVRYIEKKKDQFQMEAVFVPKDNYDQWLEAETAKIQIKR